jgi:hypothetical protein
MFEGPRIREPEGPRRDMTHERPGGSEVQWTRDPPSQRETGDRMMGWGYLKKRAEWRTG